MLYTIILLALLFAFFNGLKDSATIVASVISSRAMRPRRALLWVGLGEFIGPLIFGTAVAKTVGADLLTTEALTTEIILASLAGAFVWNLFTTLAGLPASSSHALVGGLVGGALVGKGLAVVKMAGLLKVLLALFLSPVLGLLGGFLVTRLLFALFANFPPRINQWFRVGQWPAAFTVAMSHGTNDSQKAMGIIVMALITEGRLQHFVVPTWVQVAAAGAIALGASIGGWQLIRTMGGRLFRIRPIHAFSAQLSGAAVILGAALVGGPVSTTQVMSSTIMGAGAAERINKVRWMVVQDILLAWIFTIPAAGIMAALFHLAFQWVGWV